MSELETFARTIFGEARGESFEGKVAVANVILNRVSKIRAIRKANPALKSHLYGNGTIESACIRPYQFSCWNPSDPNLPKVASAKASDPYFAECIVVAKLAMAGLLVENTKGSTHYHVTMTGFPPAWIKKGEDPPEPAVIIGKHSFYNNIK